MVYRGESKGGSPGARPPPTDQDFFNFIHFSGNVINLFRRRSELMIGAPS